MKRILLGIALASITLGAYALHESKPQDRAIDNLIAYNKMEKGHTYDWVELSRKFHDAKSKLIEKHHIECADLHDEMLHLIKKEGCSEDVFEEKLDHKIALHEKQVEEWRALCEGHSKDAMKFYHAHKQELEQFKKHVGFENEAPSGAEKEACD